MDLKDPVAVGRVNAPHGVRGTLKVKPYGSGRHLRAGLRPVVGGERYEILSSRETPKGFLVDLKGVSDRAAAARLRGEELLLDRDELVEPEEGEFYVADLVGIDAFDAAGEMLGVVAGTFETPAHEVLVVRAGSEERYVPFTVENVPEVDPAGGRIVVVFPEG